MRYVFILGRNAGLSIAELQAKLPEAKFEYLCSDALALASKEALDPRRLMHELGGTVKIGEYVGESGKTGLEDFIFGYLENAVSSRLFSTTREVGGMAASSRQKIFFGLSLYCGNGKNTINVRALGGELKNRLKETGIGARWVVSNEPVLSSVVVARNKLLTRGAEFLLIKNGDKIAIGRTLAVQEFDDLSYRDFGRPAREMEVGLLPPKIARAMINMARISPSGSIFDPFCGFGTVATEAMIMGYGNIYASDIEKSVLEGAEKNIAWVKRYFPETAAAKINIFQSPAESVSRHFKKREIDAIITEPYLGPVQRSALAETEARQKADDLGKLYFSALRDWEKILKPGGKVVMIFPSFQTKTGPVSVRVQEGIKNLPYDAVPPLSEEATRLPYIKISPQGGLIYERPGQKVTREIYVFRLNK